ncbi:DUF1302 domain-containing protein [Pseudomonas sp. gcc21]|uniref:DUF1302 domain-containing protein n=1 Tax=Pseudomonas sp. gcc21 TaxID=2726989 RepID=UPI0014512EE6|nr:DUF1302 domain-containing protein [Pseudomonas sp. gcc21]
MAISLAPRPLAALPLAIGLALSPMSFAATFTLGGIEGQFDSELSIGASWATEDPEQDFIHPDNGGRASARTTDDGRLNYEKGDAFSKIFKGSHDLELRAGNTGAFFRGKYWYDFETKDGHQNFYDISDSGRNPLQKGSGVELLDAFVYHNYSIGTNPGNVRLGRQVVSWGESLFIGNSINTINPIDVSAFRRPGAEIKEGLIPVEMLYISQGLTANLTAEAFYQLKWAPSVVDNCGTFFSTSDTLAKGCNDRLVVAGLDLPHGDPLLRTGGPAGLAMYNPRYDKDREASDSGQYGVAMRWFVPALNDTEFGVYAMNYHSRTPSFSVVRGYDTVAPGVPGIDGARGAGGYFLEYPEDIRLYGVSFQTSIAGATVAGEVSYRPNYNLQINTSDLSLTALPGAILGGFDYGAISPVFNSENVGLAPEDEINGYRRKELWQAQVSAIHFIDRVLGASRLALLGEVGVNYIGGLESGKDGSTRYGRDPLFGQSPISPLTGGLCLAHQLDNAERWCDDEGYVTRTSWGYRIRAGLDYSNVFAGVNLSPNIAWSHDVSGYGPNFIEDAKSVSLGLNADYANRYTASISYTNFFDGKYNTLKDRDFAALSVGVSF